jgi:hypothetical protein
MLATSNGLFQNVVVKEHCEYLVYDYQPLIILKHSSQNKKQATHEVILKQHYLYHIFDHCIRSISMFLSCFSQINITFVIYNYWSMIKIKHLSQNMK